MDTFYVGQGDAGAELTLTLDGPDGNPADLTDLQVTFSMWALNSATVKIDNAAMTAAADQVADTGKASIVFTDAQLDTPGVYEAVARTSVGGNAATYPNVKRILVVVTENPSL